MNTGGSFEKTKKRISNLKLEISKKSKKKRRGLGATPRRASVMSEDFVGVEEDGDGTVVGEFEGHVGLEDACFYL